MAKLIGNIEIIAPIAMEPNNNERSLEAYR